MESLRAFRPGDYARVVGAADYNGCEGEVAWVDGDRIGLWLGWVRPITFLAGEVIRVRNPATQRLIETNRDVLDGLADA